MPRRTASSAAPSRLSRESIVSSAIELADRGGLAGLSMRRLAQELGVDAMSIYYHLRDKDTLLAAMADAVVAAIEYEDSAGPWTVRMKNLIMAARATMLHHPWAAQVLESRGTPSPAILAHIERVLAILRVGGCSLDLAHHAIHLFGSRILGFSRDLFDDSPDASPDMDAAAAQALAWAETMPHVAELAAAVSHEGPLGGCDDAGEFAFALDFLLDGLERRRLAESDASATVVPR